MVNSRNSLYFNASASAHSPVPTDLPSFTIIIPQGIFILKITYDPSRLNLSSRKFYGGIHLHYYSVRKIFEKYQETFGKQQRYNYLKIKKTIFYL